MDPLPGLGSISTCPIRKQSAMCLVDLNCQCSARKLARIRGSRAVESQAGPCPLREHYGTKSVPTAQRRTEHVPAGHQKPSGRLAAWLFLKLGGEWKYGTLTQESVTQISRALSQSHGCIVAVGSFFVDPSIPHTTQIAAERPGT